MSLKILIDLQGAQNGSRYRGIGRYSLALAKGIVRNASPHRVFVLANGLFRDSIPDLIAAFDGLLPAEQFLIFSAPGPVAEYRGQNQWRRRTAEILREHIINELSPDAILVSSMVEGGDDDTIVSVGNFATNVVTVSVIYDLIPLVDPERYIGWPPAKAWYYAKVDHLKRSDLLLAISDATLVETRRLLNIEAERIVNISSAADPLFSRDNKVLETSKEILERLGVRKRFLMHSSAFEERKNFQGLMRAYAALPIETIRQFQLVLVCKLDNNARNTLTSLASKLGLAPTDVVLTGFISDDDLVVLYSNCYLFVFPSFYEGFGLPALEAMSCGAPAIGSNITSVPEVIGRKDATFDPASDAEITALILKAINDSAFYDSLKSHAIAHSETFSWYKSAIRAIQAIELAVARRVETGCKRERPSVRRRQLIEALAAVAREAEPTNGDILALAESIEDNDRAVTRLSASAAFAGSLKWRIEGPFDSTYSLAILNRETARGLAALGHKVILHSTEGPGDFPANPYFLDANPDLKQMHASVGLYPHEMVDAASRNLYPPRVSDMRSKMNMLHHYAWEESGFPEAWMLDFNKHLQGITCLSTHVAKTLVDNGLSVPYVTSGSGVDHWERVTAATKYDVTARGFRFLHVSSCFPRKGVEALLTAYGRAFSDKDDVTLIIKTFENPHNNVDSLIAECRAQVPGYPNTVVIKADLGDAELKSLYQQCHALVAPSKAEGFGLPLAEAMLSGLPVITTAWSGQLDFCNESTAWLVDYVFRPAKTHFGLAASVWADVDVDQLAKVMRDVYEMSAADRRARASNGRNLLLKSFLWRDVAARLVVAARTFATLTPNPAPPTIGWVSTWNTKCGIAAYSGSLLKHFPKTVKVFAPRSRELVAIDGPECVRSWVAGKDENELDALAGHLSDCGIGVLVVQFNYGFFNFDELSRFLIGQVDGGRPVIIVMHSTGDPGLLPEWNWTLLRLVPALARCSRVLVHSIADLNRLKTLGLTDNVTLFPHGVLEVEQRKARDTAGAIPVIASYGYCLPHKGLVELVSAVDALRRRGTPVKLRLVNAEYTAPASHLLVEKIKRLIVDLALQDYVSFHTSYLTDDESFELIGDADVLVFAYQETNESASGAVRFGLASGRPVAVTPIPIFEDLGPAVFRLPGGGPDEIAEGIHRLLREVIDEGDDYKATMSHAEQWRKTYGYSGLADRLFRMCGSLAREFTHYSRIFDGSSRQLRSDVGDIIGRSIQSNGKKGFLVYGPYLPLAIGRYVVSIQGSFGGDQRGAAYCDVYTSGGTNSVAKLELKGVLEGVIAELAFAVTRPCSDLEIRVFVSESSICRIDRISISQQMDANTAARQPSVDGRKVGSG